MKLIYGEHCSGKSSKVLELIKNKKDVFYISLDQDRSISNFFCPLPGEFLERKPYEGVELHEVKNCFLIDLEFQLVGFHERSKYKTLVIDSLNFIKLAKGVNHDNLDQIIKGLEYLHFTYDIEIISTYNTLRNIDSMKEDILKLFKSRKNWELINTVRRKDYKSLTSSAMAL
jgi:hypothetical protein